MPCNLSSCVMLSRRSVVTSYASLTFHEATYLPRLWKTLGFYGDWRKHSCQERKIESFYVSFLDEKFFPEEQPRRLQLLHPHSCRVDFYEDDFALHLAALNLFCPSYFPMCMRILVNRKTSTRDRRWLGSLSCQSTYFMMNDQRKINKTQNFY
jgi:hypothetical protein